MTDENLTPETAQPAGKSSKGDDRSKRVDAKTRRARKIFGVIMIILLLLLAGVTAMFIRAVAPVGAPAKRTDVTGMEWIRSIYGYGKAESDQLSAPNDVAIGDNGTIWVADKTNARVVGFAPDGSYRALIHQGPAYSSPRAFQAPTGVDADDDGTLWITDYGRQKVSHFSEDNELLGEYDVPLPANVAARDGRVVVGAYAGVAILNDEGDLVKVVGTHGDAEDEFDIVQGIYIDEDGTIYCTDTHNNRLKSFDRNGKLRWVRAMGNPSNKAISKKSAKMSTQKLSVQLPTGLTMDGAGRLVFVDPFEFCIVVADPKDGTVIAKYGEDGTRDGEFAYPTGIDYDPQRDWFAVADTGIDRVQIVRIPGSGGGALAGLRRMTTGWLKICGIPLLLLLVAAIATAIMRRRRKTGLAAAQDDAAELESEDSGAGEAAAPLAEGNQL